MFTLTRDQQSMVDAVRDFAENELAPHAAEWDETGRLPLDVLREAGAMGLGAMCVDERFGGSGLSRSDAVRLFEQLAEGDTTIAAPLSWSANTLTLSAYHSIVSVLALQLIGAAMVMSPAC